MHQKDAELGLSHVWWSKKTQSGKPQQKAVIRHHAET